MMPKVTDKDFGLLVINIRYNKIYEISSIIDPKAVITFTEAQGKIYHKICNFGEIVYTYSNT